MEYVHGTYNEAVVYARTLELTARSQIEELCSLPFLSSSRIRIMPDCHAGKGCTIGTTMTVHDAVVPSHVGVDIGCGMETVRIDAREIDFAKLDDVIRHTIPAGFMIRSTVHANASLIRLDDLFCIDAIDQDRAYRSLGTLGGGNHFIEVDRDDEGDYWLVIHSGSRHAGVETATFYQNAAETGVKEMYRDKIRNLIDQLKGENRETEIEGALLSAKKTISLQAYVSGELFEQYIHDMKIMQEYAMISRRTIAEEIMKAMNWHAVERFTTIHNYIDTDHMILRKGAVSARKGEKLIIPMNMRDGALICTGLGNEEWNCSAPHGAGRLYSRAEAKRRFSLSAYQDAMAGIYSTSVDMDTIDESPMAYKDMQEIIDCIGDTCVIESIIRPVYNFKAGN